MRACKEGNVEEIEGLQKGDFWQDSEIDLREVHIMVGGLNAKQSRQMPLIRLRFSVCSSSYFAVFLLTFIFTPLLFFFYKITVAWYK